MMRLPHPVYLPYRNRAEDTAEPQPRASDWPVYLSFIGLWTVILVVALLVSL